MMRVDRMMESDRVRNDKNLFKLLTVVGTLIVGLITGGNGNSGVEFAVLMNPQSVHFITLFLHSVAEFAGFNQVIVCLVQYVCNAVYNVSDYNYVIPVASIAISLFAYFLRSLFGWILLCYGTPVENFVTPEALHLQTIGSDLVNIIGEYIIDQMPPSAPPSPNESFYRQYSTTFFLTFGMPLFIFLLIIPFEVWYISIRTRNKRLSRIAMDASMKTYRDESRRAQRATIMPTHAVSERKRRPSHLRRT